jgi:enoyl-CoA hydratase
MGYIGFSRERKIGIVTFSKPEAMNSLSSADIDESREFFDDLADAVELGKEDIRVLVLTGEGKAFVSGADIAEMRKMSAAEAEDFSRRGNALMRRIETFPVPVIAAVNGYALGGGLETALSADFIYLSKKAKVGLPEVNLGIFPGFGGGRRLAARIGEAKARELVYTGRMIDADEAYTLGIANKVVESDGLMTVARETASAIAAAAPGAVRAIKSHMNAGRELTTEGWMAAEPGLFGGLFGLAESAEGLSAFLEKREPSWRDRSE